MVTLNLSKARMETKLGDYAVANAHELTDPTSHHRTQEYRRLAGSRMMALGKDNIRKKLREVEYHVSRKADGKRARVHDVTRVVRQPESKADLNSLRFAVFDLMELDRKPIAQPYAETWKRIKKIFDNGELARPVDGVFVKSTSDVEKKFDEWVEKDEAE